MKPLSRSQYLQLADTPISLFTTLRRRDQVPFFTYFPAVSTSEADDGRRVYLAIDALMLLLSNDLARQSGLERSSAAEVISRHPDLIHKAISRCEAGEEIWFAVFDIIDNEGIFHRQAEIGTRSELMSQIGAEVFEGGFRAIEGTYRIILANVSRAVRQIHETASAIGAGLDGKILG